MNNFAAIGYMIIAARNEGFPESEIWVLAEAMLEAMDMRTEEEAEEVYRNN